MFEIKTVRTSRCLPFDYADGSYAFEHVDESGNALAEPYFLWVNPRKAKLVSQEVDGSLLMVFENIGYAVRMLRDEVDQNEKYYRPVPLSRQERDYEPIRRQKLLDRIGSIQNV